MRQYIWAVHAYVMVLKACERPVDASPEVCPIVQAPCPPLKEYYAREADRRGWVNGIFDRTAADYDRVERTMAFGSGSSYRRRALQRAGLSAGMSVVDIGVGTGLVAREAAYLIGDATRVTGIDPSSGMVAQARVPAGVRLIAGCAEAIPLPDACADFLCMGYALRHISDLSLALSEFWRVLKPGGMICLLEITRPEGALARALLKAYLRGVMPLLAYIVARQPETPQLMRFYWDTIDACAPPWAIMAAIEDAHFAAVIRHVELGIFSEYRASKPLATHLF
jgi:demethylmenaquinone methyltransferase / 2-methoxy-6-polyprenyl-1,4-benzoquinol methylase